MIDLSKLVKETVEALNNAYRIKPKTCFLCYGQGVIFYETADGDFSFEACQCEAAI